MKAILDRCIKNILEPQTNNLLPKDKSDINNSSYMIFVTTGPLMMTYVVDNFIADNPDFKDYTITKPSFDECIQYANVGNLHLSWRDHWTAYTKNNEKHYSQLSTVYSTSINILNLLNFKLLKNKLYVILRNKMSLNDLQRQTLLKCLNMISLRSGFDSFETFRKYKEKSKKCFEGYQAVFPEIQVISTSDDKTYVDNLKIMTAQNLYDSKTGDMIKLTDKLSKSLNIEEPPINWWASEKWDGIRALWDGEK